MAETKIPTPKDIAGYATLYGHALIPGLILLEAVFHKGLFHESIVNIYDFLLLLVWAFLLTLPYMMMAAAFVKKANFKGWTESKNSPRYNSIIDLPYEVVMVTITYCVFKIASTWGPISGIEYLWTIPITLFVLIGVMIVTFITGWLIEKLYRFIWNGLGLEALLPD